MYRYLLPSVSSPNTGVCLGLTTSRESYEEGFTPETCETAPNSQELPQLALSTSKSSTLEKAEEMDQLYYICQGKDTFT